MIKYKLICLNCDLSFDSWFASSDEYDRLKKRKFLSCHKCNSQRIVKTLMAPKLITKSEIENSDELNSKYKQVNNKIKKYQKFIKDNFEYVGQNFAYEARSIHYNNKKKGKGIYGTASNKEVQELREEGINAETIPWFKDKNN